MVLCVQIKMLLITYHMGGHLMIASNVLSWRQALWNGFTTLFAFSCQQRCLILQLYAPQHIIHTDFTTATNTMNRLPHCYNATTQWILQINKYNLQKHFNKHQAKFLYIYSQIAPSNASMACFVPSRKTPKAQIITIEHIELHEYKWKHNVNYMHMHEYQ